MKTAVVDAVSMDFAVGSGMNMGVRVKTTQSIAAVPAEEQQRSLALYALYNFPPFTVTLTTLASSELRAEAQKGSKLFVDSSSSSSSTPVTGAMTSGSNSATSLLSYTLQSLTQTALEGFFMEKIGESVVAESHEAEAQDGVLPEIFLHLVSVDLKINMYFADEGVVRRRLIGSDSREHRSLVEHITLVAEMEGSAAFMEPHEHRYKPTNEQVRKILGEWTSDYFLNHRDVYLNELKSSDQKAFQDITKLKIATNLDGVNNNPSTLVVSDGWSSRTEQAVLLLMIIIAAMALAWIVLYVYHKRRFRAELFKLSYSDTAPEATDGTMVFVSPTSRGAPGANRGRLGSMDAVRHGGDTHYDSATNGALQVLNASDRYLSKHRPDLYEALNGKPAPAGSSDAEGSGEQNRFLFSGFGGSFSSMSYQDEYSTASSAASKYFGGSSSRKYVIPSNPFEYIYSAASAFGSYQRPPQAEPSHQPPIDSPQDRRSSFTPRRSLVVTLDEQQENFAARMEVDHDYPGDEDSYNEGRDIGVEMPNYNGYTPMSTIWRNLSNMVTRWDDASSMRSSQDGLKVVSEAEDEGGLDMPQFHHEYRDDPEEDDYNFAFKDFPRHDGTPCVMYDDFGASLHNDSSHFVIGGIDDDLPNKPVSDADFQRILSQQSGVEDFEFDDPDKQVKADTEENEEEDIRLKLERILAQRHRQIQKRSIVEKHREARARERKHQREQERRDRHRAMEMEIENLEFESFSPLATRGRGPVSGNGKSHGPIVNDQQNYVDQQNAPTSPTSQPYHGNGIHESSQSRKMPSSFSPRPPMSPLRRTEFSPMKHSTSHSPKGRSAGTRSPKDSGASDVFRPSSKTSYQDSGVSVSAGAKHHGGGGPPTRRGLHIETSDHANGGEFDNVTLDKLSLPAIGGKTAKNPSPNSVMDDLFTPPQYLRRNQQSTSKASGAAGRQHRRVNSFGNYLEDLSRGMDGSSHGAYGTPVKSHQHKHRRVNSGQQHNFFPSYNLPPANHQPHYRGASSRGVSQQNSHHRRSNSQDIRRTFSHGNKGGGSHSRSNSNDTDVLVHGIYAHTRFV